ncbi:MAG: preprotein translocase subunit YajC [Planctomycetota bacterium]
MAGSLALTALLTVALNTGAAAFHPHQDGGLATKSDAPATGASASTIAPADQAPVAGAANPPAPPVAAPSPDAKAAPQASPGTRPTKVPEQPPGWVQFVPFAGLAFMFWLVILRPQQKEQRRRQELMNQLKKNDRVVTNGGLIGTIADLSSDGRFVTLKVDDSTRIRFLRSAINGPLDEKSEAPEKK